MELVLDMDIVPVFSFKTIISLVRLNNSMLLCKSTIGFTPSVYFQVFAFGGLAVKLARIKMAKMRA